MNYKRSRNDSSSVPELNSIFQGIVVSIKEYGAFIKIPGFIKNGLVHISQLSKCRVENVNEVVNEGDKVWCKVISLGEDSNKISLSMKVVHQGTGQDLDPNGVQTMLDENKRQKYTPFSQPKITLDAVFNSVCKKCGTKGHLAQNCFQPSDGKSYELIEEREEDKEDEELSQPEVTHTKQKHKTSKKSKKRKRQESSDDDDSSLSADDKKLTDAGKSCKKSSHKSSSHHHKKKKKHNH